MIASIEGWLLKSVIKSLSEITTETKLNIGQDGLVIGARDTMNLVNMLVELSKDCFTAFSVEDGESKTVGLDLLRLKTPIKIFKDKEDVSMTVDPNKGVMSLSSGRFRYEIGLINPEIITNDPSIPPTEDYPVRVVMDTASFKRALSLAKELEDYAFVSCTPEDGLAIESKSDIESLAIRFSKDSEEVFEFECPEPVRIPFTIEYMEKALRAFSKFDSMKILLRDGYPIVIEFEAKGAKVKYAQAIRTSVD